LGLLTGDVIISDDISNSYFWFLFFIAIVCLVACIMLSLWYLLNEKKGKGPVLDFKVIGKDRYKNEK